MTTIYIRENHVVVLSNLTWILSNTSVSIESSSNTFHYFFLSFPHFSNLLLCWLIFSHNLLTSLLPDIYISLFSSCSKFQLTFLLFFISLSLLFFYSFTPLFYFPLSLLSYFFSLLFFFLSLSLIPSTFHTLILIIKTDKIQPIWPNLWNNTQIIPPITLY